MPPVSYVKEETGLIWTVQQHRYLIHDDIILIMLPVAEAQPSKTRQVSSYTNKKKKEKRRLSTRRR